MDDLSPAAKAVADAFEEAWRMTPEADPYECCVSPVAAALRAAAELLSQEVEALKVDCSKYAGLWHLHDYLNAIAAELEGME